MTTKELGQLVVKMCDKLKETLTSKGIEYSIEDDRLINFRDAGAMNNVTPEQALWGFVTKHLIALRDFIERDANRIEVPEEQWDEKIGDIIAYMVLLKALRRDKAIEIEAYELEGYVIYNKYLNECLSLDRESTTKFRYAAVVFGTKKAAIDNIEDNGMGSEEEVMTLNDAIKKGILK